MSMNYARSNISSAHFNPAATIAFARKYELKQFVA